MEDVRFAFLHRI